MKKILVVFTGGTIGSSAQTGTIAPNTQAGFQLIQQYQQNAPAEKTELTCIQPLQILSENLHPCVWTQLIQAIEAQPLADYDGIIVTHGTDTLAFTAAALGLYFHALNKPLLLVSSNYPLEHPQANGLQNFSCAVAFIQQRMQNGVFVAYTNPNQLTHIHIATRLAACLPLSGDFISVQSTPYLTFEQNEFRYCTAKLAQSTNPITLKPDFSKKILLIKPYPNLDYAAFNLAGFDAVLHDLYHSGTACTVQDWGDTQNLIHFIQRCQEHNLPCYLAPALKTADLYTSSRAILKADGHFIWNMSLETAYVKLMLALSHFQTVAQINEFLAMDLALEHL